jgi:hypothetical protein
MSLTPASAALLLGSALTSAMLIYASIWGAVILRGWDLKSGSERQLRLERRTYLVSAVVAWAALFECAALFLFLYEAERMHTLFTGAMCAAGALYANAYGYPALVVKASGFLLAGAWLLINRADSLGWDYPMLRLKYKLLLVLAPVGLAGSVLLWGYFFNIRADVITSCCGALFGGESTEVKGSIDITGAGPAQAAWIVCALCYLVLGAVYWKTGRMGLMFSALSAVITVLSIVWLTKCVSPYVYELPTHSCPFCMLQSDYWYVGYPLYAMLFVSGTTGLGAGLLGRYERLESMSGVLPRMRRVAVACSAGMFIGFAVFALWLVTRSGLVM